MCIKQENLYTFDDLLALVEGGPYRVLGYLLRLGVGDGIIDILPDKPEGLTFNQSVHDYIVRAEKIRVEMHQFNKAAALKGAETRRLKRLGLGIEPPQKQCARRAGVVYIIECGGRYKIGKTENLPVRLASFSIILPFEPIVVHEIPSANISKTECDLHRKYKSKRVRGEWFDLSERDLTEIKDFRGED